MKEYLTSGITYEEHDHFLLIKYKKYKSIKEFFDSFENALKICKKKNFSNLIIDIFNVDFNKISFTDKFDASEKIAELFGNPSKVAVITPKIYHDNFSENVASNRGAYIKGFHDINDSINWVKEKIFIFQNNLFSNTRKDLKKHN